LSALDAKFDVVQYLKLQKYPDQQTWIVPKCKLVAANGYYAVLILLYVTQY